MALGRFAHSMERKETGTAPRFPFQSTRAQSSLTPRTMMRSPSGTDNSLSDMASKDHKTRACLGTNVARVTTGSTVPSSASVDSRRGVVVGAVLPP